MVAIVPALINHRLVSHLWQATVPRAWDGTGHYAIARIYDRSIFPDTFGWTHAYFAGMPLPNFYPPMFYWCVALLHHTQLFSMETAFKLCVVVPVFLLPVSIWLTARALSDRNSLVAIFSAFICLPMLVDDRFVMKVSSGLDYVSVFQTGLYTQTLGFILLLAWYRTYVELRRKDWRFGLSCILLALTVLANFFNGIVAIVMVVSTIAVDVVEQRRRSAADGGRNEASRRLRLHILSPLIAACLTLFWVVPLLTEYQYFVTRPHHVLVEDMVRPPVWGYYAVAVAGAVCWVRRPTRAAWPYLIACLLLVSAVISSAAAPRWFPFQSARFVATLNFLIAIPAGYALAELLAFVVRILRGPLPTGAHAGKFAFGDSPTVSLSLVAVLAALALALLHVNPSFHQGAFYTKDGYQEVEQILQFAEGRKDGRYIVEVPSAYFASGSFDGRAISSYLGVQGNEALSVVFREASPHSIFFNPLVNAFSAFPDNFGISTILSDDLDFTSQPLARQIERARLAGVRYFIINSPAMKGRFVNQPEVGERHDFGIWSAFTLREAPPPRIRLTNYRPALVVSDFSLKQRRSNEYDFVRLVEEQYVSGWFDVLLAHSPETKLDRLPELDKFGALIVNKFETGDEDAAYQRLKEFAQRRPLILLSDNTAPFFRRIRDALGEFPYARIVERRAEGGGTLLESVVPSTSYRNSAIRREWEQIRSVLEQYAEKVEGAKEIAFNADVGNEAIRLSPGARLPANAPILIETTYHPKWRSVGGGQVYAVTPFFMLTFAQDAPTQLVYERRWFDVMGAALSVATLLGLAVAGVWGWRGRARRVNS